MCKKLFNFFLIFLLLSLTVPLCAKTVPAPEWMTEDGLEEVYPSKEYIRERGMGKKKEAAQNDAAAYISRYLITQVSTSSVTITSATRNNGNVSVEEQTRIENAISSNLKLSGIRYTEPYYDKKGKVWYCVAYVQREELWNQNKINLQNSRDRLFSFYKAAQNANEPLYSAMLYSQSKEFEEQFLDAYILSKVILSDKTESDFGADMKYVSTVDSKIAEVKSKATFQIRVHGDFQGTVYQKLKSEFSTNGYNVKNADEDASYVVEANVSLDDMELYSVHVIRSSVEIIVEGKNASIFSYAKQTENASGINEEIAKAKAIKLLADEIEATFIQEFNSKIQKSVYINLKEK